MNPNSTTMNSEARIASASEAIAAGLRDHVNCRDTNSVVQSSAASSEAYHNGLTNGEIRLAVVRALASLQVEVLADYSRLNWSEDGEDYEDAA